MSYPWTNGGSMETSSDSGSSDSGGSDYGSVTRNRGGAGAGGGGQTSDGLLSGNDNGGGSGGSSYGSVTRDRGSAGATDDGGGPTVGIDTSYPRPARDDSDGSSVSATSVTRDRGSAGASDGGGPTVGVGDDPSDIDVGPNPRSPVDDSDDSPSSSSDVGSITRDRGSAGASDDGGGPTLGLDDIGGDFTITGTTNQTPDEPPIAPDLVGDGSLEEALDDLNITLPGSSAANSGSGLSLWLIGGIVAVLGVGLFGGNYGDS